MPSRQATELQHSPVWLQFFKCAGLNFLTLIGQQFTKTNTHKRVNIPKSEAIIRWWKRWIVPLRAESELLSQVSKNLRVLCFSKCETDHWIDRWISTKTAVIQTFPKQCGGEGAPPEGKAFDLQAKPRSNFNLSWFMYSHEANRTVEQARIIIYRMVRLCLRDKEQKVEGLVLCNNQSGMCMWL